MRTGRTSGLKADAGGTPTAIQSWREEETTDRKEDLQRSSKVRLGGTRRRRFAEEEKEGDQKGGGDDQEADRDGADDDGARALDNGCGPRGGVGHSRILIVLPHENRPS